MTLFTSPVAVAALLLGMAADAHASGAPCAPASAAERVPAAARTMADWEAGHKIRLTLAARQSILVEMCEAAAAAAPGMVPSKLVAASETAMRDYLDRELNLSLPPRTISASLRSALGASGFSRPALRKLGRLKIEGAAGPFKIRVEGPIGTEETEAPVELFLPPGSVKIFRLAPSAGARLCGGRGVTISAGANPALQC